MKSQPESNIEKLKTFIRHPYAWPGGYPIFAIMGDGEALCRVCARTEYKRIVADTMQRYDLSFQVIATDINYEDQDLYCCCCNERIESAYSDD